MSDLSHYDDWLIRSGSACYGTPASLLRQHAKHLRWWARGRSTGLAMAQALTRIADELDLVVAWAAEHQPADTRERVEPYYQPRTPDRSSD